MFAEACVEISVLVAATLPLLLLRYIVLRRIRRNVKRGGLLATY